MLVVGDRAGASFVLGDRVRIAGLDINTDINGLKGTLVNRKSGKWLVRLDDDLGDTWLLPRYLQTADKKFAHPESTFFVAEGRSDHGSFPDVEALLHPNAQRKHKYYIVGSWNRWRPQIMDWDGDCPCYHISVTVGSTGKESFQIWVDADRCTCLHPDRDHANPHSEHMLCGPDDRGQGKTWMIGHHTCDGDAKGAVFEVMLFLTDEGSAERVDWVHHAAQEEDYLPVFRPHHSKESHHRKPAIERKVTYAIVGSWCDWKPCPMNWDSDRRCFQSVVKLGNQGFEAFQIWVDGDEKQCLHPDTDQGCHYSEVKVLSGPDDEGHGKNWIIGVHALDKASGGHACEVRLFVTAENAPSKVDWVKVGSAAVRGLLTKTIIKSANPNLGTGDLSAWEDRLYKANILSIFQFHSALCSGSLNLALRSAGQRQFPEEMLSLMRKSVEEIEKKQTTSAQKGMPWTLLPTRQHRVIQDVAYVRERPDRDAPVLSVKEKGTLVEAVEETFDGWIRLTAESGWMLKALHGQHENKIILELVGVPAALAVQEVADEPGPQEIVVASGPVHVRVGPSTSANDVGMRDVGSTLIGEVQTYHGWIRLTNGQGWVKAVDPDEHQILTFPFAEELTEQRAKLEKARSLLFEACAQTEADVLQKAISKARLGGVAEKDIARAETSFADHCKRQQERLQLQEDICQQAWSEKKLRMCLKTATDNDFSEEAVLAQQCLNHLLDDHAHLLQALAGAAASGDLAAIAAARDAAKRSGVSAKDVARTFALNSAK